MEMKTAPAVTVLMPACNAEAYIASAIQSTLRQTYSEFELWVLENGSADRTAEVARGFKDPRVKVFELGPVGFQGALQFGVEQASSEWIARMDADDLMFPERLQSQVDIVTRRPETVLVGTAYALLTPFGHVFERLPEVKSREVDSALLGAGKNFADPSVLFNRRLALEVGGYDPEFTMGDVPLWFRLLTRGKGWRIGTPLYLYRLRPDSMSKQTTKHDQVLRAREKYAPETLKEWPNSPARQSFWEQIGMLEVVAGDTPAARCAANRMSEEPGFEQEQKSMNSRASAGKLASVYYRYRNRNSYRHRRDWEKLFGDLIAPDAAIELAGSKNSKEARDKRIPGPVVSA